MAELVTPTKNNTDGNMKLRAITDHFGQEIRDFQSDIARCQHEGVPELEASPEIIKYYNQKGMNGTEHFIYQGITVYPVGRTQEIKDKEQEQMNKRNHGVKEGTLKGL